jgi:catechol 2,3-dioxygenase-like lactoylglutathione lyase family enzyme
MFDHVMLNVPNRQASMKFYTPALKALGIAALYDHDEYTAYGVDRPQFWLREAPAKDLTHKAHVALSAASRQQVDDFYQAALAAGGVSNGAPGLREHGPSYYAAYVFDVDGNNIEAVCTQ